MVYKILAAKLFALECSKLLTPTPQLALSGHQQTVCSTGTRHHTANLDIIQTAVAVRTPQILAQVAESSWKHTQTTYQNMMISILFTHYLSTPVSCYFLLLTLLPDPCTGRERITWTSYDTSYVDLC